jgi:hypothetical protein
VRGEFKIVWRKPMGRFFIGIIILSAAILLAMYFHVLAL